MYIRKAFFLILALLFTIGCDNNRITSEEVLSDILPELIDSLNISLSNLIPPPPPPIYDKDSISVGFDTLAAKNILRNRENRIEEINLKDPRLLVGLADTSFLINMYNSQQRDFSNSLLVNRIVENNGKVEVPSKTWDLTSIKVPSNFQLILESKLEEMYKNVWEMDVRKFAGLLSVSRVYFDENYEVGLLMISYNPFDMEGAGYFVIVKRSGGKWKVKEILLDWIT